MKFMLKAMFVLILNGGAVGAADSPTTAPSAPPAALPNWPIRQNYRENYSVLSEHNIFLKDRVRREDRPSATQPAPRTAEQNYVLTGVVMEGAEPRAYFEDLNRGSLVKVGIGDTLARGRITGIDIDAVAYDHGERGLTWVQVGRDLTGSVSVIAQANQNSATTSPASLGFDPNSPNLTIVQKMKLRRVQEQKR